MSNETWEAKTGEDDLLLQYWKSLGERDTIYAEVGLAGKGKVSKWRTDSTQRRLDGVRLLPARKAGIFTKKGTNKLFAGLDDGTKVELLEVKRGLSEAVLGQCLVGRALWGEQYPDVPIESTVALCRSADPLMEWVCGHPDVDVRVKIVENPEKPGKLMSSRTRYLLDETWIARIEPWRKESGGLYFTRIPLNRMREPLDQMFVNLIRIPNGPDLMGTFDTPGRLLAAVGGQAIDVIEVRKKLSRGVVGRVVAHALLLKKIYGIKVSRKLILVSHADEAIKWACGKLGVEVEVVPETGVDVAGEEDEDGGEDQSRASGD